MTSSIENFIRSLGFRCRISPQYIENMKRNYSPYFQTFEDANRIIMDRQPAYYSATSVQDFYYCQFNDRRVAKGLSVSYEKLSIIVTEKELNKFVYDKYPDLQIIKFDEDGIVYDEPNDSMFSFYVRDDHTEVHFFGDADWVDNNKELFSSNFPRLRNYIKWVYNDKGDYIRIPLTSEKQPVEEMYPFLKGESLEEYYDRFMESSANILLLIGPPGTGKTTFIRGMLQYTQASAMVTYNVDVLGGDSIFADFVDNKDTFMIMEDADTYLSARTDGNNMMHRFLNVADGLVTVKNKKLIFSTNLNSTADIDAALIRPGRCFDILKFDHLDNEQAQALAKRLGVDYDDKEESTVAEIFHKQQHTHVKKKIGFI